jgi:molybdopterin molybdotransferase
VLSLNQARETMLATLSALPAETVALPDALGRVVSGDIISREDLVPFARSAMDGFAVRSADTMGASPEHPIELGIAGSSYAEAGRAEVFPRTAIAISTGAPMPAGADAVIPIERVEHTSHNIRISGATSTGECVFPAAEDVQRGDRLIARGEVVRGATLSLLAFAGYAEISVHARPRVSILATGNELVDINATPQHGQIRNSNAPGLIALATESGAQARFVGVAQDEPAALRALLESARTDTDLIVTTGGASRGERDYVKAALIELGAEMHFREVAMRPGRPVGFVTWHGVPVCILPGNPAAAFVCFHLFVRPALYLLAGRMNVTKPRLRARLRDRVHGRPGMEYVVFAKAVLCPTGLEVAPLPNQCSALVRTAAEANAFIFVPKESAELRLGATVDVEILDWSSVAARAGNDQVGAAVAARSEKP